VATLPSGLPDEVSGDEDVTRFLTSSSYFSAVMVKPPAFLPNPANGETSVFRHSGVPRQELWQIADAHIGTKRPVHGAAIVKVRHIRSASLEVKAHEPPPRHANIVDWPMSGSDPEFTKAQQKERAALIAQYAELVRR
jgi:hypothetical protein